MEDITKIRLSKSELNNAVFNIVNRTYGIRLIQTTFASPLSVRKATIANNWSVKKTKDLFTYEFNNPNFFDIYLQEHGLKPQIIKVKDKKFMRFKKPESRKSPYQRIPGNIAFEKDGYIYAKMIRHPGVEGRRFIYQMLTDQALWDDFSSQVASKTEEIIDDKIKQAQQEMDKLMAVD